MTKIIHVNRQNIAMNAKDGKDRPVFTIKDGRKTIYCRGWTASGPVSGVANGKQLKCGARAWLETDGEIQYKDPMTFKEARNVGR